MARTNENNKMTKVYDETFTEEENQLLDDIIRLSKARKELVEIKKRYPDFVFFVSKKSMTMDDMAKQLQGKDYEK